MPTPTYDLIASNVLTSSASSVTFSSIPATYRDLVLVMQPSASSSNSGMAGRVNNDSGSNYNIVRMYGTGSSSASNSYTAQSSFDFGNSSAADGDLHIIQFMDYSATDKHKTILCRFNNAAGGFPSVWAYAQRWANTAAINTIVISSGTIGSGSTFYLYGIVS